MEGAWKHENKGYENNSAQIKIDAFFDLGLEVKDGKVVWEGKTLTIGRQDLVTKEVKNGKIS